MYPEFIAIYIGLAVIIVLLVAILCLILFKRPLDNISAARNNSIINSASNDAGNIVFCKSCATQFNASDRCCPKCGTPR